MRFQNTKHENISRHSGLALGLARQISVICGDDLKDDNAKMGRRMPVTRSAGLQFGG